VHLQSQTYLSSAIPFNIKKGEKEFGWSTPFLILWRKFLQIFKLVYHDLDSCMLKFELMFGMGLNERRKLITPPSPRSSNHKLEFEFFRTWEEGPKRSSGQPNLGFLILYIFIPDYMNSYLERNP